MRTVALLTIALALTAASGGCSGGSDNPKQPNKSVDDPVQTDGSGCASAADCASGEMCLHGMCLPAPAGNSGSSTTPAVSLALSATPALLTFGSVTAPNEKRLPIILNNTGDGIVTIDRITFEPSDAPFRLESLGGGPFWIRPGSSREIFVTFTGSSGAVQATLTVESQAAPAQVTLRGG